MRIKIDSQRNRSVVVISINMITKVQKRGSNPHIIRFVNYRLSNVITNTSRCTQLYYHRDATTSNPNDGDVCSAYIGWLGFCLGNNTLIHTNLSHPHKSLSSTQISLIHTNLSHGHKTFGIVGTRYITFLSLCTECSNSG